MSRYLCTLSSKRLFKFNNKDNTALSHCLIIDTYSLVSHISGNYFAALLVLILIFVLVLILKMHLTNGASTTKRLCALLGLTFLSRLDLAMNITQLQCKFRQNVLLFFRKELDLKIPLTVLYSCLIPLIICANLLLIFGIIKIKRNKFTSCQILFLILFLSDLTIGVVQLPFEIYRLWKTSDPTCFEAQLCTFSTLFPITMSVTLLCVILVDRYINIVFNEYYKRIVTKKSLPVTIIFTILISLTWVLFDLFKTDSQNTAAIKRMVNVYITLSGYFAVSTVIGVAFNISFIEIRAQTKKKFL